MILLDTNYLIGVLVRDSPEAMAVTLWYLREELCTSSVAWYEFLSGPVDRRGIDVVFDLLHDRVLPFTADMAAESARLYNRAGRSRRLRVDAMIAAAAIVSGSALATADVQDFRVFEDAGLTLAVQGGADGLYTARTHPAV